MSRYWPIFFLLLLGAGCSSGGGPGILVAACGPGDAAESIRAPRDGVYALTGPTGLRAQVQVYRDCPVGFEKAETGQVQAVAGERRIPLPDGMYTWQVMPDTRCSEGERIGNSIGGAVDGAFGAMRGPIDFACVCVGFPLVWVMQGGPLSAVESVIGSLFH
jgi:hypothetical protein